MTSFAVLSDLNLEVRTYCAVKTRFDIVIYCRVFLSEISDNSSFCSVICYKFIYYVLVLDIYPFHTRLRTDNSKSEDYFVSNCVCPVFTWSGDLSVIRRFVHTNCQSSNAKTSLLKLLITISSFLVDFSCFLCFIPHMQTSLLFIWVIISLFHFVITVSSPSCLRNAYCDICWYCSLYCCSSFCIRVFHVSKVSGWKRIVWNL